MQQTKEEKEEEEKNMSYRSGNGASIPPSISDESKPLSQSNQTNRKRSRRWKYWPHVGVSLSVVLLAFMTVIIALSSVNVHRIKKLEDRNVAESSDVSDLEDEISKQNKKINQLVAALQGMPAPVVLGGAPATNTPTYTPFTTTPTAVSTPTATPPTPSPTPTATPTASPNVFAVSHNQQIAAMKLCSCDITEALDNAVDSETVFMDVSGRTDSESSVSGGEKDAFREMERVLKTKDNELKLVREAVAKLPKHTVSEGQRRQYALQVSYLRHLVDIAKVIMRSKQTSVIFDTDKPSDSDEVSDSSNELESISDEIEKIATSLFARQSVSPVSKSENNIYGQSTVHFFHMLKELTKFEKMLTDEREDVVRYLLRNKNGKSSEIVDGLDGLTDYLREGSPDTVVSAHISLRSNGPLQTNFPNEVRRSCVLVSSVLKYMRQEVEYFTDAIGTYIDEANDLEPIVPRSEFLRQFTVLFRDFDAARGPFAPYCPGIPVNVATLVPCV